MEEEIHKPTFLSLGELALVLVIIHILLIGFCPTNLGKNTISKHLKSLDQVPVNIFLPRNILKFDGHNIWALPYGDRQYSYLFPQPLDCSIPILSVG